MLRFAVLVALVAVCLAQQDPKPKPPPEPFCFDGISPPQLSADERVGVRFIEAPLLSVTYGPIPGDLLHAYHVALLLETASQNYTLEFDAEHGMGAGVLPVINKTADTLGEQLKWNNAGRFCLTEGVLHGLAHWSVQFTEVNSISGAQFNDLFATYVAKTNTTAEYELMRAIGTKGEILLDDSTCSAGIRNTLLYITNNYNSTTLKGCEKFRTTSFTFHAHSVELLDPSNATTTAEMMAYYEELTEALGKGVTMSQRLSDVMKIVHGHGFVYKEGKYYRLVGLHFPYLTLSRVPVFGDAPDEIVGGIVELAKKWKL